MIRVKVKNNAVNVTSRSAVLIPSRTSELENDSDFQSAAQVSAVVGAEAVLRARADAAAEAEISAAFVKRVAAGELAVFDDGADNVPVAELAAELPYQSGGYTGCTVTRGGKNLLDETAFRAYANWRDDLYPEATTEHYYTTNNNRGFLLALPAGLTYTVSFSVSGSAVPQYFYLCAHNGSDGRLLATFTDTVFRRSAYTFTAEEGTQYYLRMGANATESLFAANMACIDWVQIEAGGRQTGYAPYDTRTYSADWTHLTGGVYGGTWDITSGVLTSTLDENGDALAQPVTYDLDPIVVETRLGNNSVWSDAGAVSVTYRADPGIYLAYYHQTMVKPFELIEKIIVGYSMTTSEPADWATNWTEYFINTGTVREPVYTPLTGETAPAWESGTYYSYDANHTTYAVTRAAEPDGTPYRFNKIRLLAKSMKYGTGNYGGCLIPGNGYDSNKIALYSQALIHKDYDVNCWMELYIENRYLKGCGAYSLGSGANGTLCVFNYRGAALQMDSIDGIYLVPEAGAGRIKSSSTIEIWGVRA